MNSSSGQPPVDLELVLPNGALRWAAGDRVSVVANDGRTAEPGDGIAADLVRMLAAGPLPHGCHRSIDAPLGTVRGVERGLNSGVDMTNWNVIVDDRFIVKIVGRLGDGDRAVRLSRAVGLRYPDAVPLLHGTLELDTPFGRTVVATVHEFLADAVDGWTWAVDDAQAAVTLGSRSEWPRELGRVVARVHEALVADSMRQLSESGDRLTAEVPWPAAPQTGRLDDDTARRVQARRAALERVIKAAPEPRAVCFAIHGDLHVGQALRDRRGALRLIDFDGDPLGGDDPDRSEAAVDVAHLLVSLDLVGAIVAKRLGDHPMIREWVGQARKDLLAGYGDVGPRHEGVPILDEARLPALEAVQLLRELRYAERYLPRWRYAADWAITHRFAPTPDLEDPPWTPPASPTT